MTKINKRLHSEVQILDIFRIVLFRKNNIFPLGKVLGNEGKLENSKKINYSKHPHFKEK